MLPGSDLLGMPYLFIGAQGQNFVAQNALQELNALCCQAHGASRQLVFR